jgi:hypothetical protein
LAHTEQHSGEELSKRFYPGLPGHLHSTKAPEIRINSSQIEFIGELPLTQLQSLAYMFNFDSTHLFTGPNRVCIQMDDSEWSASFSLDNLEITQTVSADHYTKGALELG